MGRSARIRQSALAGGGCLKRGDWRRMDVRRVVEFVAAGVASLSLRSVIRRGECGLGAVLRLAGADPHQKRCYGSPGCALTVFQVE